MHDAQPVAGRASAEEAVGRVAEAVDVQPTRHQHQRPDEQPARDARAERLSQERVEARERGAERDTHGGEPRLRDTEARVVQ